MKRVHVLAVLATAAIAALPSVAGGDARSAKVIMGTDGRDVLRGGGGADSIYGRAKDDRIRAAAATTASTAAAGEDVVSGGGGRDRSSPGRARTVVNGDGGNDRSSARRAATA